MIETILFAIAVTVSFIIGFIVGKNAKINEPVGMLYIVDDPDPRKDPYICSELYEEPNTFKNEKYVTFEIHSQK